MEMDPLRFGFSNRYPILCTLYFFCQQLVLKAGIQAAPSLVLLCHQLLPSPLSFLCVDVAESVPTTQRALDRLIYGLSLKGS
jgi:hypothetical protein